MSELKIGDENITIVSSAEQYFTVGVLKESIDISDGIGNPDLALCGCLTLCWILIYLSLLRGNVYFEWGNKNFIISNHQSNQVIFCPVQGECMFCMIIQDRLVLVNSSGSDHATVCCESTQSSFGFTLQLLLCTRKHFKIC